VGLAYNLTDLTGSDCGHNHLEEINEHINFRKFV